MNKMSVVNDFLNQVGLKCDGIGDTYAEMRRSVRALLRVTGPSVGLSQYIYTFEC